MSYHEFARGFSFNDTDWVVKHNAKTNRTTISANGKGVKHRVNLFQLRISCLTQASKGRVWIPMDVIIASVNKSNETNYSENDSRYAIKLLVSEGVCECRLNNKKLEVRLSRKGEQIFTDWMGSIKS